MCTEMCPCAELDLDKWDSDMQINLRSDSYVHGELPEDSYATFDYCYQDKKTLWNVNENVKPVDEDALKLEK